MADPMTTMFGPQLCPRCGKRHYKGQCPESVVLHPRLRDERERSAFQQGFDAGVKHARLKAREADPEWHELQRWALEQADRADAAEAALLDELERVERERDEALHMADKTLEVLKLVEPFIDAIVCYASDMDEHEPNRIAYKVRELIKKYD